VRRCGANAAPFLARSLLCYYCVSRPTSCWAQMVTSDCRTFALPFSWAYHSSSPPSVPVVAHAPHGTLFGERPAHPGSGRLRCWQMPSCCFEAATEGQEGTTTTRQIGGRSGACCTRFLPEGTERCSASERWGEGEPSALTVDTRFDVPHRGPFTVARGNTDDDNHATLNYHPQFPPSYFSPSAQDILHKLLCKDPSRRLGSGPRGAMEIIVRLQTAGHMSTMRGLRWYLLRGDTVGFQEHPFFSDIDWHLLAERKLPPPWKPQHNAVTPSTSMSAKDIQREANLKVRLVCVKLRWRWSANRRHMACVGWFHTGGDADSARPRPLL